MAQVARCLLLSQHAVDEKQSGMAQNENSRLIQVLTIKVVLFEQTAHLLRATVVFCRDTCSSIALVYSSRGTALLLHKRYPPRAAVS